MLLKYTDIMCYEYSIHVGLIVLYFRIGRTGRVDKTGTAYTFFTQANARSAADLIKVLVFLFLCITYNNIVVVLILSYFGYLSGTVFL